MKSSAICIRNQPICFLFFFFFFYFNLLDELLVQTNRGDFDQHLPMRIVICMQNAVWYLSVYAFSYAGLFQKSWPEEKYAEGMLAT